MNSTVSEKGQVTIPKAVRGRLGLRPGTEIEFSDREGELVGKKVERVNGILSLRGVLKSDVDIDEYLIETRGSAFDPKIDPPNLDYSS